MLQFTENLLRMKYEVSSARQVRCPNVEEILMIALKLQITQCKQKTRESFRYSLESFSTPVWEDATFIYYLPQLEAELRSNSFEKLPKEFWKTRLHFTFEISDVTCYCERDLHERISTFASAVQFALILRFVFLFLISHFESLFDVYSTFSSQKALFINCFLCSCNLFLI